MGFAKQHLPPSLQGLPVRSPARRTKKLTIKEHEESYERPKKKRQVAGAAKAKLQKQIKPIVRSFKNHLMINRGLERITFNGYAKTMERIFLRLNTTDPSQRQLRAYVTAMYNHEFSYSYIVNTCLAIERYGEFSRHKIQFGRPSKPKRTVKDTLTEAEIAVMIAFTKNIREKAIISTLAYSGIRNLELCCLKVRDVDLDYQFIKVTHGKGNKEGVVNISPECVRVLSEYLLKFPRKPEDWLFTTLRHNRKYHTGDLRKLLKVAAKRANIQKRVYPHLMRHSLATNLLNRGADLILVKEQLRHAFIDTTMVYINPSLKRIKAQYNFYAPAYV